MSLNAAAACYHSEAPWSGSLITRSLFSSASTFLLFLKMGLTSAFSMDPRTSLITLALLRAQPRIIGEADVANRSTCNEPVQGSPDESHWESGGCSWRHTEKCQGSVRCPHLSWPHALILHTGVFRNTSPSLAHAEAVHCRGCSVSLASCCHYHRLGGPSALW